MTWAQMADGRCIDLLDPDPAAIDMRTVAGQLSRIARFAGAIPDGAYSVAQHAVVGARAILDETGDTELAAYFLLHDCHEVLLGDRTRPGWDALLAVMANMGPPSAAGLAATVDRRLRRLLDDAFHIAAGLLPLGSWESFWRHGYRQTVESDRADRLIDAIRQWDDRMLETERRLFLASGDRSWAWDAAGAPAPIRWPYRTKIWPPYEAAAAWLRMLHDLCPATRPLPA